MMSWPSTAAQLLSPGGRAPGTLCTYQAPLDGVRGGISVIHQSDTITNVSEPLTPDIRPPDTAATTCLQPSVPPPLHIYQSINHNLLIQISGHKYSSVKTFICATTIGSFQLYLLYFCQVSSVPCYQMFSVTVTDICIGCHGLPLPTSLCSFSDVRNSVAYIFYTLWQYLEFIEGQLGPVRNVVTLDCLPGLQTTDKLQHKTPGW